MRAAFLWTISDFPGLGTLSGWNTHTELACHCCNLDAIPLRLPYSKKWCFMGHRRWLSRGHRFRLNRVHFNGQLENRDPPKKLFGSEILRQLEAVDVTLGKNPKRGRGKRSQNDEPIQ